MRALSENRQSLAKYRTYVRKNTKAGTIYDLIRIILCVPPEYAVTETQQPKPYPQPGKSLLSHRPPKINKSLGWVLVRETHQNFDRVPTNKNSSEF